MAANIFLETQDKDPKCLTFTSWNINAVKNKLENNVVQSMLLLSDIVFLNEIKTQNVSLYLDTSTMSLTLTTLTEGDVPSC